ncbi:MAG TPA: 7TM diverse intracellular signaling domain-containing protein [Oligoflexus sp.]|uniref:7TM diverse intracellular signaling domain-containing protein n=1 Tax=Oligoflexus sp. TaxID=1971216 RepID=UPI002D7F5BDF|nr:7TM diverse intracellular signaling domain-containing protein [Oligoflexus sp.]HET9240581.1 7TM diverse intracellular signaling domain-containing protein [Oligoflexus sp.]
MGKLLRLLWTLLLAGIFTASASEAAIPTQPGYLDLRKWNFARGDATFLQGHWEFFWMELLSPDEVKKRIPIQYFPMPATWHKQLKVCCGYATYHLRVDVGDAKDMALEIPHMSTAVKIFVNGVEFFKAGNVGTTEETSIPSRNSGILRLPDAGSYDIVVQISNFHHARGGTWRAMRIGSFESLTHTARMNQLIEIAFIGGIWAIGIYHLALFFLRREIVTIAFSFCCLAVGTRLSTVGTRIFEFFIDDLSWVTMFRMEYLSLYLCPPLIWFYVQRLFPDELKMRWVLVAIGSFVVLSCTLLLPSLTFTHLINWFFILGSGFSIWFILVIFRAVYLKRTAALTIAIGALAILLASVIDLINIFVFNELQAFFFHIGFLIFTICQSFAIAQIYDRFFQNLRVEEKMRRHSYNQLAKVFYPHQLHMMQQGKPLEETMPTGKSTACVLAFDIIGSSRIEHIHVKSFLENSIKRCLSIIDEGYDPEQLTATGYRIKEMGDGFLCSVGFPFRTPGMGNLANSSVQLALRFVQIFHEEARLFAYAEPIHCSIGIAYDTIEGYFPSTGTREYDVYGRSVILATRYEGMRRTIFPDGAPSSVIIIQRKVWMSLDAEMRERFKSFDLEGAGIQVRDDRDAKALYYVEIPSTPA